MKAAYIGLVGLLASCYSAPERHHLKEIEKVEEEPTEQPPLKTRSLSCLNDQDKIKTLQSIVSEFSGKYTFVVPTITPNYRIKALLTLEPASKVTHSFYEFGTGRGKAKRHLASDMYGWDKEIVALADGEIVALGRNIPKNDSGARGADHGNILVLNHGLVNGYQLQSYYLHLGAIPEEFKIGTKVKKGSPLGKVDCMGIVPKGKVLQPGSKECQAAAHNHFQFRVNDVLVNPIFLFKYDGYPTFEERPATFRDDKFGVVNLSDKNFLENALQELRGNSLSLSRPTNFEDIEAFKTPNQRLGSYKEAVIPQLLEEGSFLTWQKLEEPKIELIPLTFPAEKLYEEGKKRFNSEDKEILCEAKRYFEEVVKRKNKTLEKKAKKSIQSLKKKLRKYKCP